MTTFSEFSIDLRQMIIAIETAVSLVGMNDTNHGKRVGYIASQLCQKLGYSEQTIQFSFDLGLLHDCGVSTEQMHLNLVNHFDWQDSHIHCEIGYRLLKGFEPLQHYALPILYHHTPWQYLKEFKLSNQDARMANIIFLADRVDVLAAAHYEKDILLVRGELVKAIVNHEGDYFEPSIVRAFEHIARSEAFWIALADRHITRYAWDMEQFESSKSLTIAQVKQLSMILAYIVDQKSAFTAEHSIRVAHLAHYLATQFGLLPEQCGKVEIAGLLHDLGKLHTPDYILDKPGALTEVERSIMSQHSYETFEILRHIKGLDEIARWAAFHHEGLNGVGYPFHPTERELSVEARIVAVADIFQALVQDRPYRSGMRLDDVLAVLNDFAKKGKVDPEIVALATRHQHTCFDIAKGESQKSQGLPSALFDGEIEFNRIDDMDMLDAVHP